MSTNAPTRGEQLRLFNPPQRTMPHGALRELFLRDEGRRSISWIRWMKPSPTQPPINPQQWGFHPARPLRIACINPYIRLRYRTNEEADTLTLDFQIVELAPGASLQILEATPHAVLLLWQMEELPADYRPSPVEWEGESRLHRMPGIEKGVEAFLLPSGRRAPIRWMYAIYGTQPNVLRGCHAHRTEHRIIIPLYGAFRISDLDEPSASSLLNAGEGGIYVRPMVWAPLSDFSPNAAGLVLTTNPYAPCDTIADRNEFARIAKGL